MALSITNMFAKSPIGPIQKHIEKTKECADLLPDFFSASFKNDWKTAAQIQCKIGKLEQEADDLKRSIRANLPKSLFMPVPRTDLLSLVGRQDKIANFTKDISGLMLGRKMVFPKPLQKLLKAYVKASNSTIDQEVKSIQELDELMETGFSGREITAVEKLIKKLDELEDLSDELQVTIRAELFAIEAELPPVDVMFMYNIIDWVGELADCAQRVGSRLQILLAR